MENINNHESVFIEIKSVQQTSGHMTYILSDLYVATQLKQKLIAVMRGLIFIGVVKDRSIMVENTLDVISKDKREATFRC